MQQIIARICWLAVIAIAALVAGALGHSDPCKPK
jgi:hypothetical protein